MAEELSPVSVGILHVDNSLVASGAAKLIVQVLWLASQTLLQPHHRKPSHEALTLLRNVFPAVHLPCTSSSLQLGKR